MIGKNPPGSHVPQRACAEACYGLCRTEHEDVYDNINSAVFNLHVALKAAGKRRGDCPLFIEFSVDGVCCERVFLTDVIGNGVCQLCIALDFHEATKTFTFLKDSGGLCVAMYSHVVFLAVLRCAAAARDVETHAVEACKASVYAFKREEDRGFKARLEGVLHDFEVPFQERLKAPPPKEKARSGGLGSLSFSFPFR